MVDLSDPLGPATVTTTLAITYRSPKVPPLPHKPEVFDNVSNHPEPRFGFESGLFRDEEPPGPQQAEPKRDLIDGPEKAIRT